jgi:hypothetical protein
MNEIRRSISRGRSDLVNDIITGRVPRTIRRLDLYGLRHSTYGIDSNNKQKKVSNTIKPDTDETVIIKNDVIDVITHEKMNPGIGIRFGQRVPRYMSLETFEQELKSRRTTNMRTYRNTIPRVINAPKPAPIFKHPLTRQPVIRRHIQFIRFENPKSPKSPKRLVSKNAPKSPEKRRKSTNKK